MSNEIFSDLIESYASQQQENEEGGVNREDPTQLLQLASTSQENSTPNIDFDFIKGLEGFETEAYVPDPDNSKSGVTVASGVDLGARSPEELSSMGLPKELVQKLAPYTGTKGTDAKSLLEKNPLKISPEEADLLNKKAKSQSLSSLSRRFKEDFGRDLSELPRPIRTVLASVGFQYGLGDEGLPSHNFWKQVGSGDYGAALQNLRNYGDRYDTRRNIEADLFERALFDNI